MSAEPDITINGHQLAKHHAWLVRQAVINFAEEIKNFKGMGADGLGVNDCDWLSADVLKMMVSPEAKTGSAG